MVAVALASASTSSQQTSTIPWHIQNRYYATEVQFSIFDSAAEIHEELKATGRDVIPALVLLVDNSKSVDDEVLDQFDTEMIDVPLVVGKSTSSASQALSWEDMMQQCISKGWEYVDLSDNGDDELGGQSGISRVSEALQAHIWPMDPRSSAPRAAKVSSDSEDDEDEDESSGPEASTSQRRPRRDSNASSTDGFDDNFAPFVSAASGNHTLAAALSSPSLDDTSAPKFPSSSDYPPFADAGEEDPTAHLTDMFASFAGLREKALNMQDRNQRMNFAEEIAMKFAKQLDLLMGDELDTIPDVPLPELADSSNDGKKAENDQADKSEAKYASGTSEMTPESEVAAKSEGKSGDDNSKTQ